MGCPVVTIVMPTHNDEPYIAETLDSVLKQDFEDFELIVVDDCSSDGTCEVIATFDDPRLIMLRQESNSGPALARNRAIGIAQGKYIAFIDSDDLWMPHKLRTQLDSMVLNGSKFTYTRYNVIDERGREFADSGRLPLEVTYEGLLPHCFIRTSSVMYDVAGCGGKYFFPDLRKRQDFGLFLSLLKAVGKGVLIDEVLCSYRIRANSVSSNKLRNIRYQWRIYRDVENLSLLRSGRLLAQWFLKSGGVNMRRSIARRAAGITP